MKKEILKLIAEGRIYPTFGSEWVSTVHSYLKRMETLLSKIKILQRELQGGGCVSTIVN